MSAMDVEFEGPVVEWRGPAPFYFVCVPEEESADIKLAAKGMEYWGQVPVVVQVGQTEFTTALSPKDGRYLIPLSNRAGPGSTHPQSPRHLPRLGSDLAPRRDSSRVGP